MNHREAKNTDQENVHKAYELLIDFIKAHEKQIEPTLWVGAMIAAISESYERSDVPYKLFKKEIEECIKFYKY